MSARARTLKMRNTFLRGPLVLTMAVSLWAQQAEESRVSGLEHSWDQAVRLHDSKALGALMASELIYIAQDGAVMNKASYMETVKSSREHFAHVTTESMQVRIYGRSAIATGIYLESGTNNGKSFTRKERFIDTWVNRDGSWVCIASQSTLITH
jgi:ketosteroid isomerase-like protein